jgi:outer membrane protein, heavy metal efflux system
LRAEARAGRVDPAGTLDDPFFAAGPDEIPFEGGSGARVIRYQLSQSIPFPGKLGARADAAGARARAAEADAATVERELVVVATQTFYRALYNQRALELNRELAKLVGEATESGRARYRVGAPNHHEWLLARAELAVLESEHVRLEEQQAALHAVLNELRDAPPDTRIERLPADLPPADVSSTSPPSDDGAMSESPELESLDAVVRAADAEQRAAELAYLPDFVVQGMAEQPRHAGDEETMWGVMVGISVPIFWWRKQDDLLASVNHERQAALAERRTIENRLAAERVEATAQLESARRTAELYEQSVLPLTRLALDSARSGYAVGRVPLGELISTARAHRTQDLEYLAARIDIELARTRERELLSSPPVLQLAPATPTLFGGGMGAVPVGMGGGMGGGPSAISIGRGIGLGQGRGVQPPEPGSGKRSMGGM